MIIYHKFKLSFSQKFCLSLRLLTIAVVLAGATIFFTIQNVQAQIDAFTFFIPYPRDILDDQFDVGYNALSLINDDIDTTISIAVHRGNAVIYYDHWEDGLEADLIKPIQATTEIWGDNDPTNGVAPGFATDILNAGDVVILRNTVILPQDNSFFFDGGDVFTSVGGAVAVTLAVWPIHTPAPPTIGILYAGAWELYPTNSWGLEYHIPIGQDLSQLRPGFTVVGINVQAAQDQTDVQLDLDADGNFETVLTLNRGKQFTQISGVNVGAKVQATAPVQVHLFTADPLKRYEARAYTIVPFDQWTADILAPRSSDGDYWLYNPHNTPLNLRVQTITTTTLITIPTMSTVKYPPAGLSGPTGVRFTTPDQRPFYGVVALDADDDQDWGYALQPVNRQMTQTFVGQGRGNNNEPPDNDESRVYVTALATTTLFVDYNNDGTPDNSYPISPLAEVPITDPDHNLTGAYLYTENGVQFAAAWGQDESANPRLPSIDVGITLIPLPTLLVQKTVNPLFEDVDCSGSITLGDMLQYQIQYFNNSVNPVPNIIIQDTLPAEVSYVPNSTIINDVSVADATSGSPFLFDEGGFNVGDLPRLGTGTLKFSVIANQPTNQIINRAEASFAGNFQVSDSVIVTTPSITTTEPVYRIKAALTEPANGVAMAGQVVTFNVTITNTGTISITQFPLDHEYDNTYLTFQNANPAPSTVAPNLIRWSDLTTIFGDIIPNQTFNLTTSFTVNPITTAITTTNVAVGLGGRLVDGTSLGICRDQAALSLIITPSETPTPTLTVSPSPSPSPSGTPGTTPTISPGTTVSPTQSPSGTPTPSGDDDDDDNPPPQSPPNTPDAPGSDTPPPDGSPSGGGSGGSSTPVLPVQLLPETGERPAQPSGRWIIVVLAALGLWGVWSANQLVKHKSQ